MPSQRGHSVTAAMVGRMIHFMFNYWFIAFSKFKGYGKEIEREELESLQTFYFNVNVFPIYLHSYHEMIAGSTITVDESSAF